MGRHRRSDAGRASGTDGSAHEGSAAVPGGPAAEPPTAAYLRADAPGPDPVTGPDTHAYPGTTGHRAGGDWTTGPEAAGPGAQDGHSAYTAPVEPGTTARPSVPGAPGHPSPAPTHAERYEQRYAHGGHDHSGPVTPSAPGGTFGYDASPPYDGPTTSHETATHRYDETYGGGSAYGRGLGGYGTGAAAAQPVGPGGPGAVGRSAADGFPDLTAPGAFPQAAPGHSPSDPAELAAVFDKNDAATTAVTAVLPADTGTARTGRNWFRPGGGRPKGRKRSRRVSVPVRTGLLGVSAAVAMGAVAVAAGVLPGNDTYSIGGGSSDKVQAGGGPTATETRGPTGTAPAPAPPERPGGGAGTGKGSAGPASPSPSATPSRPATKPVAPPAAKPTPSRTEPTRSAPMAPERTTAPSASPSKAVPSTPAAPPPAPPAPSAPSAQGSPETQVVTLVNQERAKVGCSPVSADAGLARLAEAFSQDMAARGFFDHTDPDGDSPWDRAEAAGIDDLGGENIARGQADAAAVMDAWMDSPGHRANILNCEFTTLGVGAHFGSGGPWWTQNFGF
ncbi:CAP domain-containing protein [Streptomyces uncialis]|uniref:CAP domain-containing protein n=1 Tax=Streptomyces uncialis TaxID=1048205 RepID=UPI0038272A29